MAATRLTVFSRFPTRENKKKLMNWSELVPRTQAAGPSPCATSHTQLNFLRGHQTQFDVQLHSRPLGDTLRIRRVLHAALINAFT